MAKPKGPTAKKPPKAKKPPNAKPGSGKAGAAGRRTLPPLESFEYLFRYGDLIAPTLDEHKKVLAAEETCWWGWWRRATESNHHDVWTKLREQTRDGRVVRVALFNSGAKRVTTVVIDDVIEPKAGGDEPDPPPERDRLVPSYYRRSPFSRAWMRIIHIEDDDVDFFGKFSITEPPRLPGHTDEILNKLRNKVIIDGDELYGMDTSIWKIRPKLSTDNTQHYLTVSIVANESLSRLPLDTKGTSILHVSDLHFVGRKSPPGSRPDYRSGHVWALEWEDTPRATLTDAVSLAIKKDKHEIGLVIASGDFTIIGHPDEFAEAKRSLYKLIGALGIGREHLIIVPGNHDIRWTNSTKYSDADKVLDAPLAGHDATDNYALFYKQMLGHSANGHLSMARRYALPNGMMVEVCALNSSSLEHGKNFHAGMGRVQGAAFAQVREKLGWSGRASHALRLLVLHHHLVPTEDLDEHGEYEKGFGMALDAPRIQRDAAAGGVNLVLHGHRHRTFVWQNRPYELPESSAHKWDFAELSISAVGSAGSPEQTGRAAAAGFTNSYFNVINVADSGLEMHLYRSRNCDDFQRYQLLTAAFDRSEGALALGPWKRMSSP